MVIHDATVSLREVTFSRAEKHRPANENRAAFVRFRKRLNRTRIAVAKIVRNDRTSGDRFLFYAGLSQKQYRNHYLL